MYTVEHCVACMEVAICMYSFANTYNTKLALVGTNTCVVEGSSAKVKSERQCSGWYSRFVRNHDDPLRCTSSSLYVPRTVYEYSRWRAEIDEQSGSTYYVNAASNESRWTKPAELIVGSASHNNTQETSLSGMIGQVKSPTLSNWAQTASTLIRAKRAWLALIDDTTGCTYYVDQSTGISQWEEPLDMQSPPQDQVAEAIDHQDDNALSLPRTLGLPKDNITPTRSLDDNPGKVGLQVEHDGADLHASKSGRDKEQVHHAVDIVDDKISSPSPEACFTADDLAFPQVDEPSTAALQVDSTRTSASHGTRPHGGEGREMSADSPGTVFTAWRSPNTGGEGLEAFDILDVEQTEIDQRVASAKRTEADGMASLRRQSDCRADARNNMSRDKRQEQQGGEDGQALLPSGQRDADTRVQEAQKDDLIVACNDRSLEPLLGVSVDLDTTWDAGAPSDDEQDDNGGDEPDLDARLPRIDSSSTLSTYCAGLDSLAQYVTGHSSTLKTGVDSVSSRESQNGESWALEQKSNTPTKVVAADVTIPSGGTAIVPQPLDQDSRTAGQQWTNDTVSHSTDHKGVVPMPGVIQGGALIVLPDHPALHGPPAVVGESPPSNKSERDDAQEKQISTLSQGKQDSSQARSALIHREVPADENQTTSLRREEVGPPTAVVDQTRLREVVPGGVEKDPVSCKDDFVDPPSDASELIPSSVIDNYSNGTQPVTSVETPHRAAQTDGLVRSDSGGESGRGRGTIEMLDALPAESASQSMTLALQDSLNGRRTTAGSTTEKLVLFPLAEFGTTVSDTAASEIQRDSVAAVQKRLEEGMLLRRQRFATVVLQARARGFAARWQYKTHLARLQARHREEQEAKRRVATAIQAVARGHAARREWDGRKHELRTIKDDRSVVPSLGEAIPRDLTAHSEIPEENVLQHRHKLASASPSLENEASDLQGEDTHRSERFSECSEDNGMPRKQVPSAPSSKETASASSLSNNGAPSSKGTASAPSLSDDGSSSREEAASSSSEGSSQRSPCTDIKDSTCAERNIESIRSTRQDSESKRQQAGYSKGDLDGARSSKGTVSASSLSDDGSSYREDASSSSSKGKSQRSLSTDTKGSTYAERSIESIRSTREDSELGRQQAGYSKIDLQSDATSKEIALEGTRRHPKEPASSTSESTNSRISENCQPTGKMSSKEASTGDADDSYGSDAWSESGLKTQPGTCAPPTAHGSGDDIRRAVDQGTEFWESLRQVDEPEASTYNARSLGTDNAESYSHAEFWNEDNAILFHKGLRNDFPASKHSRSVGTIEEQMEEIIVGEGGSNTPVQSLVNGMASETTTPSREEQHKAQGGVPWASHSYVESASMNITPGEKLEELPNRAPGCRVDLGSSEKEEQSSQGHHTPSNTKSTLLMDKLEGMKHLVAAQAEATARITMTAAGTDTSRREATRMRYCVKFTEMCTNSLGEILVFGTVPSCGET